jgi:hypothetical protein
MAESAFADDSRYAPHEEPLGERTRFCEAASCLFNCAGLYGFVDEDDPVRRLRTFAYKVSVSTVLI